MLNTEKRMDFIIAYISAYEAKIKLANKNGLFDTAKLFELFAKEICELWFDEEFINLNEIKLNYHYVDLVSSSGNIYVQVSTQMDIPSKIKGTLQSIEKSNKLPKIDRLVFFDLSNKTETNVRKYTGDNRIGDIDFDPDNDFITTKKIVNKAMYDLIFQEKLYLLLKSEFDTCDTLSTALNKALCESKDVVLKGIESLINNEYAIDRSEIIERITSSDSQFICVEGEAGSGKSVICKQSIENRDMVLCARAERFTQESSLDDIWHFDIQKALECLNGKPICFYIDSLEFIADASKTKLDLLQSLYSVVSKFDNAQIITSCRTNDKTAFVKIHSLYAVESILVPELTSAELKKIETTYPIVKKMFNNPAYSLLVRTPFYINIIVSNITDYNSINDESQLRDYIWENVICLKGKLSNCDFSLNDVTETINAIAFQRAKAFSVGVHESQLNSKVVKKLISEGVVTSNNQYIRLKYDIFEDICFEKRLDIMFDECKGVYSDFFMKIEEFGRCAYRRYQIWVANKLLNRTNRDKFLYSIIFSNNTPQKWTEQTEIGIVKSRFCSDFFAEQETNIVSENMMEEFIDAVNLYAFEPSVLFDNESRYLLTSPIGAGRIELIRLVFKHEVYKENIIRSDKIQKLCWDYSQSEEFDKETANYSCKILEFFLEKQLNTEFLNYSNNDKNYYKSLSALYIMADFSSEWIKDFWSKLIGYLYNSDENLISIGRDIVDYTLKNTAANLVKFLPIELCNLASEYWTVSTNNDDRAYYDLELSNCSYFGLNKYAENYEHDLNSLYEYHFFSALLRHNFKMGFEWAINFLNNATKTFSENNKESAKTIDLYFADNDNHRKYYGNMVMWLAGTIDHPLPVLMSDIVFILKESIISILKTVNKNRDVLSTIANNIKETIYSKCNNILLFTIIEDIGTIYVEELPGYALELASEIDLINWDIQRYHEQNPNDTLIQLKQEFFRTVGMPNITGRYDTGTKMAMTLQEYVAKSQFINDEIRDKVYKYLDYLYFKYPDTSDNAKDNLQIQKMDFRKTDIERVDEERVAISPQITGEAQKVVERARESSKSQREIEALTNEFCEIYNNDKSNTVAISSIVYRILETSNDLEKYIQFSEIILLMILACFNDENLESKTRSDFCIHWITGIERMMAGESFIFKRETLSVLFKQIYSNIYLETKNRIKQVLLSLCLYHDQDGRISNLKPIAIQYLQTDAKTAQAIFNTIVMLAKDEMEHQKFNYSYLVKTGRGDEVEFKPNITNKLSGVDYYLQQDGKPLYHSLKEQIITEYLYNNKIVDYSCFNMQDYDIHTIYNVCNCGLNFNDNNYYIVIDSVINCLFNMWQTSVKRNYREYNIKAYELHNLSRSLYNELFNDKDKVFNVLFNNREFLCYSGDIIDFNHDIFSDLLATYYDAYSDKPKRKECEQIIKKLESEIKDCVTIDTMQRELFKLLIFSLKGYEGDWSSCKTCYSFSDKQFLNEMFSKYGKYHFRGFIETIMQMNIKELLPEVIISINASFEGAMNINKINFEDDVKRLMNTLEFIVVKAFVDNNDAIKMDIELTNAFEGILKKLINYNSEQAAIILDEFRIH